MIAKTEITEVWTMNSNGSTATERIARVTLVDRRSITLDVSSVLFLAQDLLEKKSALLTIPTLRCTIGRNGSNTIPEQYLRKRESNQLRGPWVTLRFRSIISRLVKPVRVVAIVSLGFVMKASASEVAAMKGHVLRASNAKVIRCAKYVFPKRRGAKKAASKIIRLRMPEAAHRRMVHLWRC